jgi:hypothetical protein
VVLVMFGAIVKVKWGWWIPKHPTTYCQISSSTNTLVMGLLNLSASKVLLAWQMNDYYMDKLRG